ncbi:MAG: hypothetical protein JSV50_20595, partial [Desulfobacteraceae bacterium]
DTGKAEDVLSGLTAHPIKAIGGKKARTATNKGKGRSPRQRDFRGVPFIRCTARIGFIESQAFCQ